MIQKELLKKKNNGYDNEKFLFHGTRHDNIEAICKKGFDRGYCGINGMCSHKHYFYSFIS